MHDFGQSLQVSPGKQLNLCCLRGLGDLVIDIGRFCGRFIASFCTSGGILSESGGN